MREMRNQNGQIQEGNKQDPSTKNESTIIVLELKSVCPLKKDFFSPFQDLLIP
jgi:hypothetical protein